MPPSISNSDWQEVALAGHRLVFDVSHILYEGDAFARRKVSAIEKKPRIYKFVYMGQRHVTMMPGHPRRQDTSL